MGDMRKRALRVLLLLAAGCQSSWSGRPPFTAAETERALAPVKALQRRCYDDSQSRLTGRHVGLEFLLFVDEHGAVRSDPVQGDPHDPALIECLRAGLDSLHFPAKGEREQLRVSFDLPPGEPQK
jgi:hypothetical protein